MIGMHPKELYLILYCIQCATHLNLGWKIRVVDGESIEDATVPDDGDGNDTDDDDDGNDDGALVDDDDDNDDDQDGALQLGVSLMTAIFMAIVAVLFAT